MCKPASHFFNVCYPLTPSLPPPPKKKYIYIYIYIYIKTNPLSKRVCCFSCCVSFLQPRFALQDLAVDWSEFCQYIAKGLAEKEIVDHEQENPVMMCAAKFPSKHLGRIVRLEALSSPTRFVSICEDAIACFWSSKMAITQVTHMDSAAFISPRASLRVTDGCYMPNASTIVICTNARDMRFHHALTGQMTHKMLLPEIVLTMTLHIDETKPDKATLAYGDFKGNVTAIEFYKATEALFEPPKVSKTSGFKSRTDSHGRRRQVFISHQKHKKCFAPSTPPTLTII